MNSNLSAFLTMIAISEIGHKLLSASDNGYNILVGGELFSSYSDHPRKKVWIKSIHNFSTAAGRYQILQRNYDYYKQVLHLDDFSPKSQDLIAIKLIKERDALKDILNGRIDMAIYKIKNIWASLPGAGYNQHENQLATLLDEYKKANGELV